MFGRYSSCVLQCCSVLYTDVNNSLNTLVQCTVYSVQCTQVKCTVYTCTVNSVRCTPVHCKVFLCRDVRIGETRRAYINTDASMEPCIYYKEFLKVSRTQ